MVLGRDQEVVFVVVPLELQELTDFLLQTLLYFFLVVELRKSREEA